MAGIDMTPHKKMAVKKNKGNRKARGKNQKLKRRISTALLYIVAFALLALMVLPYYYLIIQSLSPWNELNRTFWPSTFTLRSYIWLFLGGVTVVPQPWLKAFFNSFAVTITSTFFQVAIGAGVAYGLSILKFKGAKFVNNFILFQMFYPSIILLVPTFLLVNYAGLYDSFWAMLLPTTVSLFAIFVFAAFFTSLPMDIIEAARLDGASEMRIILRIVLPMARPIITVVSLFLFVERWSSLMWDMIVVKTTTKQTLNVLIATMFGPYGAYQGPLYATGVLLTLPLVILFLIFSKNFVKGFKFVIK